MENGNQPAQSLSGAASCHIPHYDAELMELSFRGAVVKRLDGRATNQILLLTVFEEDGWPSRIDDPLPPNGGDEKTRLRDTVYSLNGGQHPRRIHFFADGTGHGIRWKLVSEPSPALTPKTGGGGHAHDQLLIGC